jgi:hypothetical protein
MQGTDARTACQVQCLDQMRDLDAEVIPPPMFIRLRLPLTRRMDNSFKRTIVEQSDSFLSWFSTLLGRGEEPISSTTGVSTMAFQVGDWVRVRSEEEIKSTLNHWRQLKGCTFMAEMAPYCGTIQRVLKPVKRFMDERDHQLKKTKGLVLLERANCQGTDKFGPCDRHCFYFWREEWLEKIEGPTQLQGSEATNAGSSALAISRDPVGLKAGEQVRVRSREEIEATLEDGNELGGCLFMPEMWTYCNTTQRVLQPMETYLDERDYQVKRCKGVVLLNGLICQGTESLGPCDRACFYFWREEWLERID